MRPGGPLDGLNRGRGVRPYYVESKQDIEGAGQGCGMFRHILLGGGERSHKGSGTGSDRRERGEGH